MKSFDYPTPQFSEGDERDIIIRLITAYRYATDRSPMDQDSMWFGFFVKHQAAAHAAFYTGDVEASRRILSNPSTSKILYGFENLFDDAASGMQSPERRAAYATRVRALLSQLSVAIGLNRLDNPSIQIERELTDDIVQIEAALGFRADTPPVYPDEFGLETARGILTVRAVAALYQAHRVKTLTSGSVCEIGGGLGRTALYARAAGISDYTLVDIPFTAISQGYYLLHALGPEVIALPGEQHSAPIRIMAPDDFMADERRFDLALNADSITEFAPNTAVRYAHKISTSCARLLSINHEGNRLCVHDLFSAHKVLRFPHWMRPGYVEEIAYFE
jgi:putative sugar O-methyltransferase